MMKMEKKEKKEKKKSMLAKISFKIEKNNG